MRPTHAPLNKFIIRVILLAHHGRYGQHVNGNLKIWSSKSFWTLCDIHTCHCTGIALVAVIDSFSSKQQKQPCTNTILYPCPSNHGVGQFCQLLKQYQIGPWTTRLAVKCFSLSFSLNFLIDWKNLILTQRCSSLDNCLTDGQIDDYLIGWK